jgi:two-component system, chemotaxis family, chemotaxis protein CheY
METMLVVDDSATSRAIFKACLPSDADFMVSEANSFDSAIAVAKELEPDVCVLDYNLPDKTGLDIAKAIIDLGYTCRFVLMTANMQDAVVMRAKALNFVHLMEKPITIEKINIMIEALS